MTKTSSGPIREYFDAFIQKAQSLKDQEWSATALAIELGLYDFQLIALFKEHQIQAHHEDGKWFLDEEQVKDLKEHAEDVAGMIPLTSYELSEILDIPKDSAGTLISDGVIIPFERRKRRKHLRSFFRLEHCLEREGPLLKGSDVIRQKVKKKQERIMKKHQSHQDDLLSKRQSAAERVQNPNVEVQASKVEEAGSSRFELDEWQKEAIHSMERGCHVFVQAPTGAGKTAVVEEYLRRNLDQGIKVFYAVPIKALANDKFVDFCDLYGQDRVGINTGDITIAPSAQVVVGTTEILRNILFDSPETYDLVAFDEAQYLGDLERGSAWEEAIILSGPDTILTFLSGSVANAEEVLSWIRHIKDRDVGLFIEEHRPVPLKFAFPYEGGFIERKNWRSLRDLGRKTKKEYYGNPAKFFEAVEEASMTPLLAFMPRRRDCEEIFQDISSVDRATSKRLAQLIEEHPDGSTLNPYLRDLIIRKGVAFHHSGRLPSEKRVVESLAKRGELRIIAATMSLASGVNFSVRSCLIFGYQRPGHGGSMQDLAPSEILQMWGRAGRRRLDTEGYVIPCMDIEEIEYFKRVKAFPEPIIRKNFVSAVNILSILRRYGVEMLEELYLKSFSGYVYNTPYRIFADHVMKRDAGAICEVPTYNLPPYRQGVYKKLSREDLKEKFHCTTCSNLETCTKTYEAIKPNPLNRMAKHLKVNGFMNDDFTLTYKGRLAERFHAEIGLMVAEDIMKEKVRPDNIVWYCASANASAHIGFAGSRQRSHHEAARMLYPVHLFPSLWERFRGRKALTFWNPGAGEVAEDWVEAEDWASFSSRLPEKIQGDVFRMLLRAGELLRSMAHLDDMNPALSEAARVALKLIMRPPLVPDELFRRGDDIF